MQKMAIFCGSSIKQYACAVGNTHFDAPCICVVINMCDHKPQHWLAGLRV